MRKYVYIISSGHSGSTLLDLLLGSHSKVVSLGEISHLPKNLSMNTKCTCGAQVQSCPFWKQVVERLSKDVGFSVAQNPYKFDLGLINPIIIKDKRHESKLYHVKRKIVMGLNFISLLSGLSLFNSKIKTMATNPSNNLMLYNEALNISGKEILVDSSKIYQKGIDLYRASPDNIRIVLLSRDGRGVLYSNLKRNICSRRKAVSSWKNYYNRSIDLINKYIPSQHVHSLKYENLACNPINELTNLCAFLDIPFEPEMLNFLDGEHHITNGNNMRFASSSKISLDESWKFRLSKDDIDFFNKKAGSLNSTLGYLE